MQAKIIKQLLVITLALVIGAGVIIINPISKSLKYGFDKPALNTAYENQQCAIPFKQGDWTDYCNIKKFDPADGELKNIKITLIASTKSEVKLENLNVIPVKFDVSSKTDISITDESKNELINNTVQAVKQYSLDQYDGITDYKGKSGTIDSQLIGQKSERTNIFGDNIRLSSFVKTDNNDQTSKAIFIKSQGVVSSTNNMDYNITTQTEVNIIKFQYEYEVGDLAISKFHEPQIFEKGKIAQIKIKVTNNDQDASLGTITVKDNLPEYLQYISQDNNNWICTNVNNLECKSDKILAGKEESFIVINVKVLDTAPKSFVNTASVTSSKKEYNYDNNQTTDTIQFGIAPKVPLAYDCDLGITNINQKVSLSNYDNDICLKGTDPDGDITVVKFMIKSLPNPTAGKLVFENVDIPNNFVMPIGEQNKLVFVPSQGYIGKYSFTYTAIDETNLEDLTPATVKGEVINNKPVPKAPEPATPTTTITTAPVPPTQTPQPIPLAPETVKVEPQVDIDLEEVLVDEDNEAEIVKAVEQLTRTGGINLSTYISIGLISIMTLVLIIRKFKKA